MLYLLWPIVFIGLLVFAFRKPKGKRWGWVLGAILWLLVYPSLLVAMTPGSTTATTPTPSIAAKQGPGSLRIFVTPSDARVTVQGPNNYYRKATGSNKFGNLPPGDYTVTISKPGYDTLTKIVSVIAGSNQSFTYQIKSLAQITAEKQAAELAAQKEANCSGIQLIIEDWHWSQISDSFVKAEGRVTNVSGQSLDKVVAKVSFFTKNDEFITSQDTLIDYQPVLNGQTSPFSVIATYNPAMRTAQLELAEFWGSTYRYTDRKTWNKYACGS